MPIPSHASAHNTSGDRGVFRALSFRLLGILLALAPSIAVAGGPKYIAGTAYFNAAVVGQPVHWAGGRLKYYVDQGPLSSTVTIHTFSTWSKPSWISALPACALLSWSMTAALKISELLERSPGWPKRSWFQKDSITSQMSSETINTYPVSVPARPDSTSTLRFITGAGTMLLPHSHSRIT